jgi:DnaD/phage-associated family protein
MKNINNSTKHDRLVGFEVPFFQVDNDIFDLDLGLDIYHKMVYIYLCRCGNQRNDVFPSYSTIAEKCGCSKRKAIDAINDLINFGLLQKKIRKTKKIKQNLSNIYFLKPISSHYLCRVEGNKKSVGSAQYAPGGSAHHALGSAHHAPKKELLKKNLEEDDETFSPAIDLFIKAKGKITQLQKEDIKELVNTYSLDFVVKAIQVTSDKANGFNMSYIKKVLKSYKDKGHETLKDIEDAENAEDVLKDNVNRKRKKNMVKQLETAPKKNTNSKPSVMPEPTNTDFYLDSINQIEN